jgi:hypothetical protein
MQVDGRSVGAAVVAGLGAGWVLPAPAGPSPPCVGVLAILSRSSTQRSRAGLLGGLVDRAQGALAQILERQPGLGEDLGGQAVALTEQAQQDVFGADVVVLQA